MMCYRDMTFCPGDGCQRFDTCSRALTEEVQCKAQAARVPIAQFEWPDELQCYLAPKKEEEA